MTKITTTKMARAKMIKKTVTNRFGVREVGRITGYEPCKPRKSISDPKTYRTTLVSEGQIINWHKKDKKLTRILMKTI